jgi:hypothetical protein
MAFDRDRGVTLLFASDGSSDLWQFDGKSWSRIAVSGPRPADRLDAALAYDPVRRVVMLAGGFGRASQDVLADTWTFSFNGPQSGSWTRQADLPGWWDRRISRPVIEDGGRTDLRMVFDESLGGLVVFGGSVNAFVENGEGGYRGRSSSWSRLFWSGGDWVRTGQTLPVAEGLEYVATTAPGLLYDTKRRQVLLHGGRVYAPHDGGVVHRAYDGLGLLGTNGVTRVATRPSRFGHRMVYDVRRDRYVVFGGAVLDAGENPEGRSRLEGTQPYLEFVPGQNGYPQVVPTNPGSVPAPRVGHDMVYDEWRGVVVMYGGALVSLDAGQLRETWELRPLLVLPQPLPDRLETCARADATLVTSLTLSPQASSPGGVNYVWRHQVHAAAVRFDELPRQNPTRTLNHLGDLGVWDVVMTDACGNSITSNPCRIQVNSPPAVRVQPVSQQVCPGEPLEVSVAPGPDSYNALLEKGFDASPERPVRYQWYRQTPAAGGATALGIPNTPIAGATEPTLRFAAFQPADNGLYRCRLSNDCGDTDTVTVELTAGVWIKHQPTTTTNEVCGAALLELAATGKGTLRYQWRRNGEPVPADLPRLAAAPSARLAFASLRYFDDASYDCVVSDDCNSVTSRVAGITVLPNPPFLLVDTNGPAARERHGLVYDSVRGVMVLFGGLGQAASVGEAYRNDTWEYDGERWSRRVTSHSPAGRVDFGMAFDRLRNRVVLFGGMTNDAVGRTGMAGDTWEYDGNNWLPAAPARAPVPRVNACLFYDPVRRVTTLYGGDNAGSNPRPGDLWNWDGTNWTPLSVNGPRPLLGGVYGSPVQPRMAWDERRGYAVLPPFPGNAPGSDLVTWTWDGVGWTEHPTPFQGFGISPAQTGSGMWTVYDRFRGEVIYGSGAVYDQEYVWRWTGEGWRRDQVSAFVGFHINAAAAYDERRNSLVVFGGNSSSSDASDMAFRGLSPRTFERVLADEPRILRQPVVMVDDAANRLRVRVVAAGVPPLSYEWQRDGVKLPETFPYGSTTNAVLVVDRGLAGDVGRYRCVVRGKCGEAVSLATTLAGDLDRGGPVLAMSTAVVAGQPGLTMTWSGAGVVLEQAPSPVGPWVSVPGATSPFRPPLTGPGTFFRLRAP